MPQTTNRRSDRWVLEKKLRLFKYWVQSLAVTHDGGEAAFFICVSWCYISNQFQPGVQIQQGLKRGFESRTTTGSINWPIDLVRWPSSNRWARAVPENWGYRPHCWCLWWHDWTIAQVTSSPGFSLSSAGSKVSRPYGPQLIFFPNPTNIT